MFNWKYKVDTENNEHLEGIIKAEDIINAAVIISRKLNCNVIEITSIEYVATKEA